MTIEAPHNRSGGHPGRGFAFGSSALLLLVVCILVVLLVIRHTTSSTSPITHAKIPLTSKSQTPHSGSTLKALGVGGKWHLILNASFHGRSIDSALWRTGWFGTGVTGPINATETACYDSNAARSDGGDLDLALTAARSTCEGHTRAYTGAVLSSDPHDGRPSGGFEYRYGVLQAKIFLPGTRNGKVANWPSVITLGQNWPTDGEDDVIEGLSGIACAHFHSPGYAPGGPLGKCDASLKPGWHTFTANWEPGSVTWYYDDAELKHITRGVTSAPMYIALVNSVASWAEQVAHPATMKVAYVRVWQKQSL